MVAPPGHTIVPESVVVESPKAANVARNLTRLTFMAWFGYPLLPDGR